MTTIYYAQTLDETLHDVRITTTLDELDSRLLRVPWPKVPWFYFFQLPRSECLIVSKLFLLGWYATHGTQAARGLQLKAALASYQNQDSLVIAGTGSGKTFIIALLLLIDGSPDGLSLTISPLKRLQKAQVEAFGTTYGIMTAAINDETPHDDEYWNNVIHNMATRTPGTARHLIVTTEQLFRSKSGHLSRLYCLIHDTRFQQRIRRIHVDEAHFIFFAGEKRYGIDAFREAWGRLREIKDVLPSRIPWQALTASCPPHLDNLDNYNCFLRLPFEIERQPRVLLFFDLTSLTRRVAFHLTLMSDEYLTHAHEQFTKPDGKCWILCATSGESTGVDFPAVDIVCNAGLPGNGAEDDQRGGRVLRTTRFQGDFGLYVIFWEPWADEIDLDEYGSGDDPDRPRSILTVKSSKRDRAPLSSVSLVKGKVCIRESKVRYNKDTYPKRLDFTGPFCCDRHNNGFDLQNFLPGPLLRSSPAVASAPLSGQKRPQPEVPNQSTKAQKLLVSELQSWRHQEHKADPLRAVRPEREIITDKFIKRLARVAPSLITAPLSLLSLLEETTDWMDEWGKKLYDVISDFNCRYPEDQPPPPKRARKANGAGAGEMNFIPYVYPGTNA
ncbi:P-loop containing nucleoside triphosphate hydrolase protein [Armillaria borealis]|uniref:DNA 3'-5' helicase n=1 Tax=Armillaria borealis TaxID=47425 RepID=A0AA39J173_9AGAR|nr:P-loop containing nucleoside triphosphate hydrolase protein [Armillaria borealis]